MVRSVRSLTPDDLAFMETGHSDSVLFTHYCAMGNHPRMRLKPGEDGALKSKYLAPVVPDPYHPRAKQR